jgi:Ca-activated chloride channel family protein
MLWMLLAVPLFGLLYFVVQRRRISARSSALGLWQGAIGSEINARRHIPPAIFLVGLTILIFSLARPQLVVILPKIEGTVILAFDVSGSMAADDLKPTRMEAAKAAARDFVQRQPSSVQIGVVAFSGSGLTVQTPTDDKESIFATIERLKPELGTSLAQGILAALNTIYPATAQASNASDESSPLPTPTPVPAGTYTSAAIVLITDGENTAPPDPLAAAQLSAERGVRIHTIGIGSAAGTTLEVEGFIVHTQLDEVLLQQISQITGGVYFNAETEQELDEIYDNLALDLVIKPEDMEVTSILAGASIFVLLIGGTFSFFWFNRLP